MADVVDCLHPPSPRFLEMPDIFSSHSSLIFNCLHPQSNSTLESVSPLLELPGTIDCISSLGCGIDDGSRLPISSSGRICSWRSTHHQGSEILSGIQWGGIAFDLGSGDWGDMVGTLVLFLQ